VSFEVMGFEKRSITEPTNENVLKGSKEAFIEVLRTNTALVRRRIQSPDLKIHQMRLGQRTSTTIAVIYLDGVANKQFVDKPIFYGEKRKSKCKYNDPGGKIRQGGYRLNNSFKFIAP
jgi:hypothetical protein